MPDGDYKRITADRLKMENLMKLGLDRFNTVLMEANSGAGSGQPVTTPTLQAATPQTPLAPATDPNAGGTPVAEPNGTAQNIPDNLPKTQADLDRIIQREKAKAQKQAKEELETAARQAQMTEAERLKAEKDAAVKETEALKTSTNNLLIVAEARVQAMSLGARAETLDYIIKMADLEGIEVTDGKANAVAIQAVIAKIKTDVPTLFGMPGQPNAGVNFQGGGADTSLEAQINEAIGKKDWSKVTDLQLKKYDRDKLKT